MSSFTSYYRTLYETFGYPLTPRAGVSPNAITAAEKRLSVKVPAALRDYYLTAGQERRFGACYNRLLAPEQWRVDKKRLVFIAENQGVVWWGVSTRNPDADDPPVSQGVNEESIQWAGIHRKCSVFLAVMLHYQAVNGGFRFCGSADAHEKSDYRFEDNGWTYYGELNSLQAYGRPKQVVCLMPLISRSSGKMTVSILAGAKTKGDLQVIGRDLGVTLA